MATRGHPEDGTVATAAEIEVMASVLEGRHGVLAAEIAEFLAAVHREDADPGRCRAWASVAARVRDRERRRLG